MYQLVPPFILERMAAAQPAGQFQATCLFADTAGFTPLTSALMAYGVEGTEVTAQILRTIFQPLVRLVYAHGGFVAGFAGDALKAVFPGTDQEAAQRCLLAAAAMREHMAAHAEIATHFGAFAFAAKISLADGPVEWTIWQAAPADAAGQRQSAAYSFSGAGLARCLELDAGVAGGEIALSPAVAARLDPALAQVEPANGHYLLRQISPALRERYPLAAPPARDSLHAAQRFMPDSVLSHRSDGEFRQVVTVFLNLRELPEGAGWADFQATFFDLLQRHGGYLCRIGRIGAQDAGTTALLFWGAPVSFEHDLRRALDFLLELRQQTPVTVRAGVTSQLVYAGFVGADMHAEYTCHGAAVNLAARLMVQAAWGEVLLDHDCAGQARPTHRCLPHGNVRLKGIASEQAIYALHDSQQWQPRSSQQLVGRERELGRLRDLLAPLNTGRAAGMILLTGEAGMGKSRLLEAAQRDSPYQWLHCPADRVARQSLHPFRSLLRHYFAQSAGQSREENLGLFQFGLESLCATIPDPALRRELKRAQPLLADLIELEWPDPLAGELEPKERFANTLNALKTFFKAESLCQPLVIVLEDGQWLDGDSLSCIQLISRNIAQYPLALVMAARAAPTGLASDYDSIQVIALTPLDALALERLAEQQLGGPVSRELVVLLAGRSEGSPYVAEQLLLFMQQGGQITQSANGLVPLAGQTTLPATVRALLTARLDRLEPAVRHTVQVAALLGHEVEIALLSAMLDGEPALASHVAAAAAAGIWHTVAPASLIFSHDLLRDAAYDMQLRAWQRRMHQRAAASLQRLAPTQIGAIAYHCEQAGDTEQAITYLQQAGDQATDAHANSAALDFFQRLARLLAQAAPPAAAGIQLRLLLKQADLLTRMGSWAAARAHAEQALNQALSLGDASLGAEIWGRLGEIWRLGNDYERALTYQNLALEHYAAIDDQLNLAKTLNRLGAIHKDQGAYAAALPCFQRAVELNQPVRDQALLAQTLNHLGLLHWRQSSYQPALECYQQALAISRQRGDRLHTSRVIGNLGLLYWHWDQPGQALECYQQALELSEQIGFRAGAALALGNMGLIHTEQCDYEQASAIYRQAIALDSELGNEAGVARHLGNLGLVYGNQGRFDQALDHHQQALEINRRLGKHDDVVHHLGNLAEVWRYKGDYAQALALCAQTIPLLRELDATYYLSWQLLLKAELLFLCGRLAEARPLLDEGLALAQIAGERAHVVQGQALAAHLLAAEGQPEQGLRELGALLAACDDTGERALFLHELWRLGGQENHRQQAINLYQKAYAQRPNFTDGQRLAQLLAGERG